MAHSIPFANVSASAGDAKFNPQLTCCWSVLFFEKQTKKIDKKKSKFLSEFHFFFRLSIVYHWWNDADAFWYGNAAQTALFIVGYLIWRTMNMREKSMGKFFKKNQNKKNHNKNIYIKKKLSNDTWLDCPSRATTRKALVDWLW